MTVQDVLHQLKLEISENENRKDFSFNEKMAWAKMLEEEYGKVAKENSISNLKEGTSERQKSDIREIGRTDDKVAQDVGFGSRDTYRKAKYILENASEDLIKQLDEGQLSVNKAYITLKEENNQLEQTNKALEELNPR